MPQPDTRSESRKALDKELAAAPMLPILLRHQAMCRNRSRRIFIRVDP
jgi:hypothetical protein